MNDTAEFRRYPLYIAKYSRLEPVVTPVWQDGTIWQFSDGGVVQTVSLLGLSRLDLNYYNGLLNALKNLPGPTERALSLRNGAGKASLPLESYTCRS